MRRRHLTSSAVVLLCCWFCFVARATGQAATPARSAADAELHVPPVEWAQAAAAEEQHAIEYDKNSLLRYKVSRTDAKGRVVRQVVESRQGSVARLLQRDGQPLTTTENDAERERLQAILDEPDAFLRHMHREDGSRAYATELLRAMPAAMLWSYTPGQPQLPDFAGTEVVLDFTPDPNYKPGGLVEETLTGIAGRVWVDAATRNVLRMEGRTLHAIDFGWGGVLARVRQGGTVALDQRPAASHRWLFSHMVEHIAIREVLVHTVEEDVEMTTYDVQAAPQRSYREAVQWLLSLPVITH